MHQGIRRDINQSTRRVEAKRPRPPRKNGERATSLSNLRTLSWAFKKPIMAMLNEPSAQNTRR